MTLWLKKQSVLLSGFDTLISKFFDSTGLRKDTIGVSEPCNLLLTSMHLQVTYIHHRSEYTGIFIGLDDHPYHASNINKTPTRMEYWSSLFNINHFLPTILYMKSFGCRYLGEWSGVPVLLKRMAFYTATDHESVSPSPRAPSNQNDTDSPSTTQILLQQLTADIKPTWNQA